MIFISNKRNLKNEEWSEYLNEKHPRKTLPKFTVMFAKVINNLIKRNFSRGRSNSIGGRVFALHTGGPDLILTFHIVPKALPALIPESRSRASL